MNLRRPAAFLVVTASAIIAVAADDVYDDAITDTQYPGTSDELHLVHRSDNGRLAAFMHAETNS